MEQIGSETVAEGFAVDLTVQRFRRADGTEVERQVVEHPGSVAILAHDEGAVYLVRQPREAVYEDGLLEIPAGTLDVEGESELECAQRELSEEAGLRAEHWQLLQVIYPSPGYVDERVTIFEATGLSPQPGQADPDEQIEVVRLPLGEIDAALPDLRDACTLVALLLLRLRSA
ncbi:MAG TPA: NUDIX hydrolase [Solirubrobacterales bacterium]|nr:NUDIX hydrolase [Solirubrobacterales bacterium]